MSAVETEFQAVKNEIEKFATVQHGPVTSSVARLQGMIMLTRWRTEITVFVLLVYMHISQQHEIKIKRYCDSVQSWFLRNKT